MRMRTMAWGCLALGGLVAGALAAVSGPASAAAATTSRQFSGVSCVSWTFCVAVGGSTRLPDSSTTPLAQRWNGASWRAMPIPHAGAASQLSSVSCVSKNFCAAVGKNQSNPLIELWNGSSWRAAPSWVPASGVSLSLTGVSCVRASFCLAIGTTDDEGGGKYAIWSTRWNGHKWLRAATPAASAGTARALASISCASASNCVAVGYQGAQPVRQLVYTWHGSRWRAVHVINAPNADQNLLLGVSCGSSSRCMAVGFTARASGSSGEQFVPLAQRRTTSGWHRGTPPAPRPSTGPQLSAVACTGRHCMVTGSYLDSARRHHVFSDSWTGSSWTVRRTANIPSGGSGPLLPAISCPKVNRCVAVGSYTTSSGQVSHLLTEVWNGKRWTRVAAA